MTDLLGLSRRNKRSVVNQFDCLCSSVAFNCCQFSCCIPDVPNVEFSSNRTIGDTSNGNKNHYPDWMQQLIEQDSQIKLRDMIVPGTHDSASYAIPWTKVFSAVGKCQGYSITDQLYSGARFLDLRVAGGTTSCGGGCCNDDSTRSERVSIWHGCLECCPIEDIIPQISNFITEHPMEFLFIDIVQEFGREYTPQQKLYTLQLLDHHFGQRVFRGTRAELMDQLSLQEVVQSGKNICLLLHPRFYNDFVVDDVTYDRATIEKSYGFVNDYHWLRSHWHNTRDASQLLEWNAEEVQNYGTTSLSNNKLQQKTAPKILNNQFVLTPGVGGVSDVASLVLGMLSLRPVSFATKLYRKDVLDVFFRNHTTTTTAATAARNNGDDNNLKNHNWNLIMLDYIDLTPALISYFINLNFPSELIVSKAVINTVSTGPMDVTEKVQSYIQRGKVLYLIDIQKDIGVEVSEEEGSLTIVYRWRKSNGEEESDEKHYSILTLDFHSETELVLGKMSRNEEAKVIKFDPTEESTPSSGYYTSSKGGQIIETIEEEEVPEPLEDANNNRIVLKYTVTEAEENPKECVFEIANI